MKASRKLSNALLHRAGGAIVLKLLALKLVTRGSLAALVVCAAGTAYADGTLSGTFIDYLGVGNNGVMLNSVGRSMRYSPTGAAPYSDDLYAPGVPIELFAIEATDDGGTFRANNNSYSFDPPGLPTIVGGQTTVSGRDITWTGRYSNGARQLRLRQTFNFPLAGCYTQLSVEITNEGPETLRNLYFLRAGDPDQGNSSTGPATNNDVVFQPPASNNVLVTAAAGGTPSIATTLGIGAYDSRARGFVTTLPQNAAPQPSALWLNPGDPNGAPSDSLVGMVYRIDSLAPGTTERLTFFYLWGTDLSAVNQCFTSVFCKGSAPTTPCEADGLFCTLDACDGNGATPTGVCVNTGLVTCSSSGTCVQSAMCDEGSRSCVYTLTPNSCAIDNACFAAGDLKNATVATCLVCDPTRSSSTWSPVLNDPVNCPTMMPPDGGSDGGNTDGGVSADGGGDSDDGGVSGCDVPGGCDAGDPGRSDEVSGNSFFCHAANADGRWNNVGCSATLIAAALWRRRRRTNTAGLT